MSDNQTAVSDTPETDKQEFDVGGQGHNIFVWASFARTLERQRNEARTALEASKKSRSELIQNMNNRTRSLLQLVKELKAEYTKLMEMMEIRKR